MFLQRAGDRAGVAALLTVVLALTISRYKQLYPYPHIFSYDIDSPILALELSGPCSDARKMEAACGVDMVFHRNDKDKSKVSCAIYAMRMANRWDLLLIPVYTFFLWASARLFTRTRTRALACVVGAAALFDYLEDWQIFRALGGADPAVYIPSLAKWGLLATALIWTATILFKSRGKIYSLETRRLLGIAYFIAGTFMAIAVVLGRWIGYALLEEGMQIFSLLIVIHVVGLLGPYLALPGITRKYVPDFCEQRKQPGKQDMTAVEARTAK